MKKIIGHAVGIALALAMTSCGGDGASSPPIVTPTPTPTPTPTTGPYNRVGFFNPLGTPAGIPSRMEFGMMNAYNVNQVQKSLVDAQGTGYKVNIDFSEILLERKNPNDVGIQYETSNGGVFTKNFKPLLVQKLAKFPNDAIIYEKIQPYIDLIKNYKSNMGAIFLADEPYLNGISKREMERAGSVVRKQLDDSGLSNVKLGVIFAAGMFDKDFAHHLNLAAGDYARGIDAYYERGMAIKSGTLIDTTFNENDFDNWVSSISNSRLTTYDIAGNMYTDGGIPSGFEIVTFDYYLATTLLDEIYVNTLSYFASRFPNGPCRQFIGKTTLSVRQSLSYFQDGPQKQGDNYLISDRQILDSVYQCRMTATFDLIRAAANAASAKVMMISEASSNGFFEYYANGSPKSGQPMQLVESRVYDEVVRGLNFYSKNRKGIECGLMYFLYDDAFDHSINLQIYGVSSFTTVLDRIYNFAAVQGAAPNQCD